MSKMPLRSFNILGLGSLSRFGLVCSMIGASMIGVAALPAPAANAQFSNPAGSQTSKAAPARGGDTSILRPPAGARVAIFEFEDLECPDCARANPLLKEAAAKYRIPWIRHDFPLPFHAWSFDAAVDARWFDTKSKKMGDDFRDAVFASQNTIHTAEDARAFAEKFATDHNLAFPFVVDPQGKLAQACKDDYALGQRAGVEHTPTIWVVTNKKSGVPFVEVVDRTHLYEIIDQAIAETGGAARPNPAK